MRVMLLMLMALAIGKVVTLAYIRQKSATETIISAYREQAVAVCQRQVTGIAPRGVEPVPGRAGDALQTDLKVELIIGREDLNVRLWQTSHPKWSARYRDPYLIIKSGDPSGPQTCKYDIKRGTAQAQLDTPKSDT